MSNLRILNITGNTNLTKLPSQLTTCDSLIDIVLDAEYILYPPNDVIERGTSEILKYLLEKNGGPHEETTIINSANKPNPIQNIKQSTIQMLEIERGRDVVREMNTTNEKYSREKVGHFNYRYNYLHNLLQFELDLFVDRQIFNRFICRGSKIWTNVKRHD